MNGMMRYWRMLVLLCGVLMYRDVAANSIFYSTASAGRNIAASYNSNLDAYQDTTLTLSATGGANPELRGLFMLKSGFTINTNAYWNAEGIVDGPMILGSNALNLMSNLHLGPNGQFDQTAANNIFISGSKNFTIFLGGDNTRISQLITTGSPFLLDGNGHTFTVKPGGQFNVSNDVFLSNMVLDCQAGSLGARVFANNARVYLSNSIILNAPADGDYTQLGNAATYSLTVTGDVRIEGFGTRVDFGSNPLTIGKNSTLTVAPGVALTGLSSLTMTDTTSILHLDGCDFYVGWNGLQMTRGTLILEDKARIFNKNYGSDVITTNTTMSQGFVLGDGVHAGNDVNVVVRGGASVIVDGCMWYNNA